MSKTRYLQIHEEYKEERYLSFVVKGLEDRTPINVLLDDLEQRESSRESKPSLRRGI